MRIELLKYFGIAVLTCFIFWLCIILYTMYDLRTREFLIGKEQGFQLTEATAVTVCRKVLTSELNLKPEQLKVVPYQTTNASLMAANERQLNEGNLIWYVAASGYKSTQMWHIHTKITVNENNIIVSVNKAK